MITVAILINGNPIMARSAVNTGKLAKDDEIIYHCDDGQKIRHNPDHGAVVLAKKLLDTINEKSTTN